jgi:hypothetical protein
MQGIADTGKRLLLGALAHLSGVWPAEGWGSALLKGIYFPKGGAGGEAKYRLALGLDGLAGFGSDRPYDQGVAAGPAAHRSAPAPRFAQGWDKAVQRPQVVRGSRLSGAPRRPARRRDTVDAPRLSTLTISRSSTEKKKLRIH